LIKRYRAKTAKVLKKKSNSQRKEVTLRLRLAGKRRVSLLVEGKGGAGSALADNRGKKKRQGKGAEGGKGKRSAISILEQMKSPSGVPPRTRPREKNSLTWPSETAATAGEGAIAFRNNIAALRSSQRGSAKGPRRTGAGTETGRKTCGWSLGEGAYAAARGQKGRDEESAEKSGPSFRQRRKEKK